MKSFLNQFSGKFTDFFEFLLVARFSFFDQTMKLSLKLKYILLEGLEIAANI